MQFQVLQQYVWPWAFDALDDVQYQYIGLQPPRGYDVLSDSPVSMARVRYCTNKRGNQIK